MTLHRPANVENRARFARVRDGFAWVARRLSRLVPVHPRARGSWDASGPIAGLTLVGPLGYLDLLALEAGAALVLTDSGGVQKEATVLGVLSLILRDNTERPITIAEGPHRLVSDDPDRIDRETTAALERTTSCADRHAGTVTPRSASWMCWQQSIRQRFASDRRCVAEAGARVQLRLSTLRWEPLPSRYP